MNTLFIRLLNLSIAATWIILAVLLVRALARKAPKWFPCLLWALVGIRLLCPVTIQSPLSLVPSDEAIPENITEMEDPRINTGIPFINKALNPASEKANEENEETVSSGNQHVEANPQVILPEADTASASSESSKMTLEQKITIASYVWIGGLSLMLGYALFSYIRLRRSLTACISVKDGVLACDEVKSPFILGVFRPKIYVPSSISEDALKHVIAHEKSHIKRHDHWWKPLGFLILSVYWFHPLCWVAYVLLCRDIEMACDEKVIRMMKKEEAASYSQTLLDLSSRKTAIAACPVAFGEVGVKQRVKNVLNYKKPGFWVIVGLIIISVAVSVLFLTRPVKKKVSASKEVSVEAKQEINMEDLKSKYPQFFGLSTKNGLVVYVSQFSEHSYHCYLKEEGAGEPTIEETISTDKLSSLDEMRTILKEYDISPEKVRVASYQHPLSSYLQVNDPNEGALERYEAKIRKLFFRKDGEEEIEESEIQSSLESVLPISEVSQGSDTSQPGGMSDVSESDTSADTSNIPPALTTDDTERLAGSRVAFAKGEDWVELCDGALNSDRVYLSHEWSFPLYRFDTREELDAFIKKYSAKLTLDEGGYGYPSFVDLTSESAGYDSTFFAKKSVMAVYVSCENTRDYAFLSAQGVEQQGESCEYHMYVITRHDWPRNYTVAVQAGYFLLYDVADADLENVTSYNATYHEDDYSAAYDMKRNSYPQGKDITDLAKSYSEKELLYEHGELIGFSQEAYYGPDLSLRFDGIRNIRQNLPTAAIRQRDDDSYYMMFLTEKNYRLYLFFSDAYNKCRSTAGYGLVVGKVHSYSDFSNLQEGDSIDDVIAIDDVAALYKEYLLKYVKYNPYRAGEEEKTGAYSCSLHYLNDGLLKIEYTMKEEGKLIIRKMAYYPDYILKGADNKEVNYKILDEDLPK